MVMIPVNMRMEGKLLRDIHSIMDLCLKNEDGIIVWRMYEGSSKQEWYRQLMRAGLRAKLQEHEEMRRKLSDESHDHYPTKARQ